MYGSRKAVAAPGYFNETPFDPAAFASTQYTEANDTKYTPVPAKEYAAVAKIPDISKAFRQTDKGQTIFDVLWEVDDEEARQLTGMPKPTVRQSIFLDMAPNGQGLDMSKGKNVKLGQLREALSLNVPGQPFSFTQIDGRPARITVKHRQYEGDTFADVKEVTKL